MMAQTLSESRPSTRPHATIKNDTAEPAASAAHVSGGIFLKTPARPSAVKAAPAAQTYRKATPEKTAAAKKEEKAEQMNLEPANRGRFEKSEPTIVDGQDLDVPTFLRKNLKLK